VVLSPISNGAQVFGGGSWSAPLTSRPGLSLLAQAVVTAAGDVKEGQEQQEWQQQEQ
jgi:hypothetical protein